MFFEIAPEVLSLFPDYCVGFVVATPAAAGAATGLSPAAGGLAAAELRREAERLRAELSEPALAADPALTVWRQAFQRAGLDGERHPSSAEALLRRVARGEEPPVVNPAVDLANLVSLRHRVPVGAHDLDRLRGRFQVRLSREGDRFTPLGHREPEPVPPGEIVYADEAAVRTRRWVWRLGEGAKVTAGSRSVFFPIDGFQGQTDDRVRQAAADLAELLARHLGARVFQGFVDAARPALELPAWTPAGPDPIERLLTRRIVEVFPSREELAEVLRSGKKLRIYLGVDATSPVIHVGHAVQLQKLREFQELGHKVILLVGDFTGRIGDPTDKSAARAQLTREQVAANLTTYAEQASKILDFDAATGNPAEFRLNGEWWDGKTAADVLELSAYFTVQQMLQRDMYQKRLAENRPIGLHEFLYPVLQGYDSVALDVDAELGGTDQTFNMLAGRTLVRGMLGKEKFVLTGPLLEGTDGRKMSKSYGNVIGVSDPPHDVYGKVMSLRDDLVLRYFELVTSVSDAELAGLRAELAGGVNPMLLKKRLAAELVSRFHGPDAAREAAERFEREVQRRELPPEVPTATLPREGTWPLVDLLVAVGLAAGRNEAKRLIEGGSVEVDGVKVTDPRAMLEARAGTVLRGRRRQYVRLARPAE